MTWPSSSITTTNLDNGAVDDPSVARADILDMAQKVNTIVANGEPLTLANGGTVAKAVHQSKAAIALANIDLSLSAIYSKTIAGATTFTVSNVPAAGTLCSFILDITNGGSAAVTWWAGVKWQSGVAPALTVSGRDCLGFFTHDGGTIWTGLVLGTDVR